jgi:hypothetical protein
MTPLRRTVLLLLLFAPAAARARNNGMAGASGQGQATCNDCHSGGPAPTVQLTGPTNLAAGATGMYRLVISGGAAQVGGLGVSVDDPSATLNPLADTMRQVGTTQLVHNAPVPFVAGTLAFDFSLTAPAHEASLTIYAAGNSCNGDGLKTGDQAAMTTLQVGVSAPPPDAAIEERSPVATPQAGCSVARSPTRNSAVYLIVLAACGLFRRKYVSVVLWLAASPVWKARR